MTNADMIRQMTDKQLAELLAVGDCFICPVQTASTYPRFSSCEECALYWLKQAAENTEKVNSP